MQIRITLLVAFQLLLTFGLFAQTALTSAYFNDGPSQNNVSETNSAGQVTTFTVDETCQTLRLSITDPAGAPLEPNKPYTYRTRDANGNQVLDFTGQVNATFRVRSAAEVELTVIFVSGGGTTPERTFRKEVIIPGNLAAWTVAVFDFDPVTDFDASFDPADIKEMYFYLDRQNDNFPGNEFYIDYIVAGGDVGAGLESPCPLNGAGPALSVNDLSASAPQLIKTSGTAFSVSTIGRNDACEYLTIRVTDPANAPLPAQNAYQLIVNDGAGGVISDLTGNVNVTLNVQSREEVNVDILFRSGDNANDERTVRQRLTVPAGLDDWTELSFFFTAADFDDGTNPAFDPTDLRDIWLYLDRGNLNFPGNLFVIDDVTVGGIRDASITSPCTLPLAALPLEWGDFSGEVNKQEVTLNWATSREEGTSHFEVERSYDGSAFTAVGRVVSAGFSTSLQAYGFNDDAARPGTIYYRLRQVDLDGAFSFSTVLRFAIDAEQNALLFPNPASDMITIKGVEEAAFQLRDLTGKLLRSGVLNGSIDVSELCTGQYVLRVNGANYRFVKW